MLPLSWIVQHSLIYGGILSAVMSILIIASLYLRPQIWVGDAPSDIQAAAGPMSAGDRRLKRVLGFATLLFVGGILTHAILGIAERAGRPPAFLDIALTSFLIIQVFNVVDLLLIDWLLVVTLQPRFVMLPGTEHMPGYRDYGFHFRAFLKGVAGSLVASIVIAAITVGIAQLG
ncbi:MAG TPA: hypothetical protein VNL77_13070 [Roseiflexaceae bacterium]|nr:hypothetical protein [Roseiflexaceae bacterium]